jgi:hypothetical protein
MAAPLMQRTITPAIFDVLWRGGIDFLAPTSYRFAALQRTSRVSYQVLSILLAFAMRVSHWRLPQRTVALTVLNLFAAPRPSTTGPLKFAETNPQQDRLDLGVLAEISTLTADEFKRVVPLLGPDAQPLDDTLHAVEAARAWLAFKTATPSPSPSPSPLPSPLPSPSPPLLRPLAGRALSENFWTANQDRLIFA